MATIRVGVKGRVQWRYWWLTKQDGVRAVVRAWLAPRTLCNQSHPDGPLAGLTCDRKRHHGANHADRRWCARMLTPRQREARRAAAQPVWPYVQP